MWTEEIQSPEYQARFNELRTSLRERLIAKSEIEVGDEDYLLEERRS